MFHCCNGEFRVIFFYQKIACCISILVSEHLLPHFLFFFIALLYKGRICKILFPLNNHVLLYLSVTKKIKNKKIHWSLWFQCGKRCEYFWGALCVNLFPNVPPGKQTPQSTAFQCSCCRKQQNILETESTAAVSELNVLPVIRMEIHMSTCKHPIR